MPAQILVPCAFKGVAENTVGIMKEAVAQLGAPVQGTDKLRVADIKDFLGPVAWAIFRYQGGVLGIVLQEI